MFHNPDVILLSIIAGCVPVFGLIIYFGLKSRQRNLDTWMRETTARLVRAQISCRTFKPASLVYGNFADASSTVINFNIKNQNDIHVGQAVYDLGSVTLTTGKDRYLVVHEGLWKVSTRVRPLKGQGLLAPQIAECTGRGLLRKKYLYNFGEAGTFEVCSSLWGRRALIWQDGRVAGEWFSLGPYELSGKAVVLALELPLIYQIILLAGPFTQRQHIPY